MEISLGIAQPAVSPSRTELLMSKAKELEATFLSEMLAHSGLGELAGDFGGGHGEEQYASFLRFEQAKLMAENSATGLSELIFNAMVEAENDSNA